MAIEFTCKCGETFQVGDEFAGRKGRCPSCKRIMHVPEKETEPLELQDEIFESHLKEEMEVLDGLNPVDPRSELEELEKSMDESSLRSTSRAFLDRVPKPLLFGVPAAIIAVVGLVFLLTSSGDKTPAPTAPKASKEKPTERGSASAPAAAAKPPEPPAASPAPISSPPAPVEPPKVDVALLPPTPSPAARTEEKAAAPAPSQPPARLEEKKAPAAAPAKAPPPSQSKVAAKEKAPADKTQKTSASKASPAGGGYTVNVASFRSKGMADAYSDVLKKRGLDAYVREINLATQGKWFRVSIGRFSSRKEADERAKELKERENLKAFVVLMGKEQG
jgi:cell division protein FtsN